MNWGSPQPTYNMERGTTGHEVYPSQDNGWQRPTSEDVQADISLEQLTAELDVEVDDPKKPAGASMAYYAADESSDDLTRGVAYDSYSDGISRSGAVAVQSSFGLSSYNAPGQYNDINFGGAMGGEALDFGMPMLNSQPKTNPLFGLQMAKQVPTGYGEEAFKNKQTDAIHSLNAYSDDTYESEEESSEMGMEEEEDEERNDEWIRCLPSQPWQRNYRRDSTFRSTKGGKQTVDDIKEALRSIILNNEGRYYGEFNIVDTNDITGQFHSDIASCEFMINTYSADGEIWVEIKHMTTGEYALQAYTTLFHEFTTALIPTTLVGLVEQNEIMFNALNVADMPKSTMGCDDSEEEKDYSPTEEHTEEIRSVLKDLVRELAAANYLTNQRALTEEILFVAQNHAALVAEIPGLAKLLSSMLRKNAEHDTRIASTILSLIRALMPYEAFTQALKEVKRIPKGLMKSAEQSSNTAWRSDVVKTLQVLEKVGICNKKKKQDAFYRSIQERGQEEIHNMLLTA